MFEQEDWKKTDDLEELKVFLRDKPDVPKTSIMATIGPACFSPRRAVDLIPDMVLEGMNVVRINLAHIKTDEDRQDCVALLKALEITMRKTREPLIITADLAGPKIRIGRVITRTDTGETSSVSLNAGDKLTLTLDPHFGISEGTYGQKHSKFSLGTDETDFHIKGVSVGNRVSMDDGCFQLKVEAVRGKDIICVAQNDWVILSNKGVNFPGCKITESALTQKDFYDIEWLFGRQTGVARNKIHYLSLSFVKSRRDVEFLRDLLNAQYKQSGVRIISKIETAEAVSRSDDGYPVFREILEASDGIMVARGDLGAEVPFQDVPEIQRKLIEITHRAGRPIIVATQMLEYMVEHDFATRAEVTDVTNAILEGADVTMLSAETSKGRNPVAAVKTMRIIARRACERIQVLPESDSSISHGNRDKIVHAMAHPVVEFAEKLSAKLIVSFTHSGDSPIAIAKYRPRQPVVAITYNPDTLARLGLYRGIYTVYLNFIPKTPGDHRDVCSRILHKELRLTKPGDLSVVTMSMEIGAPSDRETNVLYVLKH